VGDEPLLLASRLPDAEVAVSRDRLEGVRLLASRGAQVVVADDAFQHRRMGRDVDIALVDASCPFGNGRIIPAGILRESPESLRRAHFVLLTKAEQVSPEELLSARARLLRWVPPERLFTARVRVESWIGAGGEVESTPTARGFGFCAIGNPISFRSLLGREGISLSGFRAYRDHHRFDPADLTAIGEEAARSGAEALYCTEKDLFNLPSGWVPPLPLRVPRITVALDEEGTFFAGLIERLRPRVLVASNGYGEDAIGSLLARRLKDRFPSARVSAFALVGDGASYRRARIEVASPPSDLPSGGVVKYSFRALLGDFRHGLAGHIRCQLEALRLLAPDIRTPLCVGDVYLLLHILFGQGTTPALVATAKTVYLGGHWRTERIFLRNRCRRVWTRDGDTAEELARAGVEAVFEGNPIMDLERDEIEGGGPRILGGGGDNPEESPWVARGERILLLPGSRPRAYEDIRLLLGAVERIARLLPTQFVVVPAPTIDEERLFVSVPGWGRCPGGWAREGVSVRVARCGLVAAAREADLVLGLGGTANQVCAGLGVPVVSILEKGKLVQKKLLQEAERLVPPTEDALAEAVVRVLTDRELRHRMIDAGIRRLGGAGALDRVVDYAASVLGFEARDRLYRRIAGAPLNPSRMEDETS
jgi:tetraacyldisaccharide 4'-kinase